MSTLFGKAVLCDQSNISTSRAYINKALLARGMIPDAESQVKFNSADAPAVINLMYNLLRKSEDDENAREVMSTRLREIGAENDRLVANEKRYESKMKTAERELGVMKNHLAAMKDDLAKNHLELKQVRDSLTKTTVALNHTKTQTSNDLRKRDAQIARMKEHLADGGTVRRSKVASSMSIRTNSASINNGPPVFANYAVIDSSTQSSLTQQCDDQLARVVQEVSRENDSLAELLQATLTSLDALVQIEAEEHPLFSSTTQSTTMLEAQLKVRLTALRNILDMPNYVPVEEVELRDNKIKDLQQSLLKIESEWSAAQNVLKGLTASVLQGANAKPVQALNEWDKDKTNIQSVPLNDEVEHSIRIFAKTPVVIARETGKHVGSTIKIDSRLLKTDENSAHNDSELDTDSTPIRARKTKAQRRNRRATLGLLAKEEDLHAELAEVLSDTPHTPESPSGW